MQSYQLAQLKAGDLLAPEQLVYLEFGFPPPRPGNPRHPVTPTPGNSGGRRRPPSVRENSLWSAVGWALEIVLEVLDD